MLFILAELKSALSNKYVVFLLMALSLLGAAYWKGYQHEKRALDDFKQAITATAKAANDAEQQAFDAQGKILVKKEVQIQTRIKEIQHDVEKVVDRPIYRNQCLDDDGLRDANAALAGPSSTRTP